MPVETGHPKGALILPVIPESRSDIRDPVPLCINVLHERHWVPAFAGMTKIEVNQSIPSHSDEDRDPVHFLMAVSEPDPDSRSACAPPAPCHGPR